MGVIVRVGEGSIVLAAVGWIVGVADGAVVGLGSTGTGVFVGGSLETAARLSSSAAPAWQAMITNIIARPSSINLRKVPLPICLAFTNIA